MLATPWGKLLRRRADLGLVAMFVFATVAIGCASYQRLFASFASYDDEGYVMVSLRQFMASGALYDQVYSQYGPAYYWLETLFHRATDWPVTHDVTRIKTLAVWMSVSLLAAGWLYRVTRSPVISTIGLLLVSFHLERLAMEPGHPQELCLLAVAVCMVLGTYVRGSATDLRSIAGLGVATAICLLTKFNVGIFLLLSLSAALLFATRAGWVRNLLLGGVVAAMVALPIVIARHELISWHGYRLPMLLTISIALTIGASKQLDMKPIFELRHAIVFWGVSFLVSAAFAIGTVAAGTSLPGLADGLLFQHMNFVRIHYHDPPIHTFAPLAALMAVVVAGSGCEKIGTGTSQLREVLAKHRHPLGASPIFLPPRSVLTRTSVLRAIHVAAFVLIVGAGLRHLVETFQPLYHGSQDRGQIGLLVSYFTPYVWVILLPVRNREVVKQLGQAPRSYAKSYFARLSLCLIAVLQPLIAFPVPGTQMAIGSLALVVALLAAIHDAIESLRNEKHFLFLTGRGAVIGLVGLLFITVVCRDVYLWTERSRLSSLDLAGASRLRLPDETAATERWTVEQLQQRADTFVCVPSGHNSLYLWSGIEPPTGFNVTVWQDLLTDQRQREIVAAIDARQRVCVVMEHSEPASLRPPGPLLDYLRANFKPVASRGSREIWERRPTASVGQSRHVKLEKARAI